MADARWRRLTGRIAKGLLLEDPARIDPYRRQEAWELAGVVAELLSFSGPAWVIEEIGLGPQIAARLEELGLAVRWADGGGGTLLALTQRAADLGRRIPSSDGGLRDPEVSRAVAISHDKPEITPYRKPEGTIPYAQELAASGRGFFSQARWAS